jgi:SpoIID/LytB domain protein
MSVETPATNDAVATTRRQVVLYGGTIATTYFFSSSGGRTVSAADLTGTSVPYLVSVDDPYDSLSPVHNWGPFVLDASTVAKELRIPGQLLDLRTIVGSSGRVQTVDAIGTARQLTLSGADVRTALGLRSTWFSLGWLALTPPATPVAYGSDLSLSGTARGVGAVTLEARPAGGDWQPVSSVRPDANGKFITLVRPQVASEYRLRSGDLEGALVSVEIVPVVQATVGIGSVEGTTRPALAGASVQLQREEAGAWKTVARATTDSTGSFTVPARLRPGSYRVRFAPGAGLSPGFSQTLPVT